MILVTGAKGMLGSYVGRVFADKELCLAGRDVFDVCHFEQGADLCNQIHPQLVIHLAAETNVDYCEQDPDHAYRSNVIGTQNVARLCATHGAELVYVSTTGIFDGDKPEPYTEFDEPHPINVYGKTKWEGEKIVRQLCPHAYILRAGWVFGGGPATDKKFVGKIIQLCRENDEIKVVNDKIGSPTSAEDFVRNTRHVAESGFYGTYHLTSRGSCTRYDIACEVVKILGLKTRVTPVSSAIFPMPALRPRNDAARNYHLELLGLDRMRSWQESLADYLEDWSKGSEG